MQAYSIKIDALKTNALRKRIQNKYSRTTKIAYNSNWTENTKRSEFYGRK